MEIVKYISGLLYKHDYLVLPGFGGFVASYAPAKIHPINHTFLPPSKNIIFNANLTRDDGLLIHEIVMEENVSYGDASRAVDSFVSDILFRMDNGHEVMLEKIGIFQKDSSGNFYFDPDLAVNYLEESYGLTSFVSPPVNRESVHRKIEKQFTDRKLRPVKNNKSRKIVWISLAAILLLMLSGWFLFIPGTHLKIAQQGNLLRFSNPAETREFHNADANTGTLKTATPLKDLSFEEDATNNESLEPRSGSIPETLNLQPLKKYYVIGGAFRIEGNAEKLISDLRSKGYSADHAGLTEEGLFMVCYFSSPDRSEALINLALIRKEDNPSAWLLRK
jgi:hypothetical protein